MVKSMEGTMQEVEIFKLAGLRGSVGDPKIIAEYLLKVHKEKRDRRTEDPTDVKWQDIELPNPIECPEVEKVLKFIMDEIANRESLRIELMWPWSILHNQNEQTYPHNHGAQYNECDGSYNLACVYWVQVPEGSGLLEMYPTGRIDEISIPIEPVAGEFMVFPGHIVHGVKHNTSTEPRISMSFNMKGWLKEDWQDTYEDIDAKIQPFEIPN